MATSILERGVRGLRPPSGPEARVDPRRPSADVAAILRGQGDARALELDLPCGPVLHLVNTRDISDVARDWRCFATPPQLVPLEGVLLPLSRPEGGAGPLGGRLSTSDRAARRAYRAAGAWLAKQLAHRSGHPTDIQALARTAALDATARVALAHGPAGRFSPAGPASRSTLEAMQRALDAALPATAAAGIGAPVGGQLAGAVEEIEREIYAAIAGREGGTLVAEGDADLLSALLAGGPPGERPPEKFRRTRAELLPAMTTSTLAVSHLVAATLLALAQRPSRQQRAHDEAGGRPAASAYTAACVIETLRLSPPVPTVYLGCVRSTLVGPFRVDAGSSVALSVRAAQQDPRSGVWERPSAWVPERWTQGGSAGTEAAARMAGALVPLGAGVACGLDRLELIAGAAEMVGAVVNSVELGAVRGWEPHVQEAVLPWSANGVLVRARGRS
ncbi:unnamed protein product [Pedinophyceae sp. YPF-701]|nr:unnamed protein product [Pedinophyceae sp. YPF-701]